MDTTKSNYRANLMDFECDPKKEAINLKKHGVSFEDAVLVFHDVARIEIYDKLANYQEDRWVTIGMAHEAILYVVYTVRDGDSLRLISARKANGNEQKQYRQAND